MLLRRLRGKTLDLTLLASCLILLVLSIPAWLMRMAILGVVLACGRAMHKMGFFDAIH